MNKLRSIIVAIWGATIAWRKMFIIIFSNTIKILINPSYMMFASVAIVLATLGVWVEFFPSGFSSNKSWHEQINNLSVFTFCIALLGSMAVEYIFDSKWKRAEFDSEKEAQKHLAFFFWFVSLVFSFSALKSDLGNLFGLSSTILLWLYVNSHRERFDEMNSDAVEALNPRLNSKDDEELGGEGL